MSCQVSVYCGVINVTLRQRRHLIVIVWWLLEHISAPSSKTQKKVFSGNMSGGVQITLR